MINFLFCTVPPRHSKVDQTHKFDDFSNLIQLFTMTASTVLVEIKVVRNYVLNNFELHDQLSRIHSFHSKSLWSCQNSAISQKKSFFNQLQRFLVRKRCTFRSSSWCSKLLWITLLTLIISTKTLYCVNENNCIRFLRIIKFVSLVNFGGSRRKNSAK